MVDKGHGGDIYRNKNVIDFSSNCNPYGPPESVVAAACTAAGRMGSYPDIFCEKLKGALADRFKLPDKWFFVGNGAAEVIYAISNSLKPGNVLIPAPTFSEYEAGAILAGSRVRRYYTDPAAGFAIGDDFVGSITEDVDLVFVCNPNNPTGTVTGRELMERILKRCRTVGAVLAVDECFLPFSEGHDRITMTELTKRYDNLIVIRAFTKIYAMAGVRLGFGICSNEEIIEKLEGSGPPWNVSLISQEAGLAALKETGFVDETTTLIIDEKRQLKGELESLGLKVLSSEGNYLFFRGDPGLAEKLLGEGILIRDCSNYEGLDEGYYRTAVKRHKENLLLIDALKRIL